MSIYWLTVTRLGHTIDRYIGQTEAVGKGGMTRYIKLKRAEKVPVPREAFYTSNRKERWAQTLPPAVWRTKWLMADMFSLVHYMRFMVCKQDLAGEMDVRPSLEYWVGVCIPCRQRGECERIYFQRHRESTGVWLYHTLPVAPGVPASASGTQYKQLSFEPSICKVDPFTGHCGSGPII